MDWNGCEIVETVSGKVSGAPVIKGTRVQADAVLENYEAGESVDEIAYNFDLRPEDIDKVLAFAASRQAANPHPHPGGCSSIRTGRAVWHNT